MPRQARIDALGALHHIIARGMERREFFLDQRDCDDFLSRLGKIVMESETLCYAWALVSNHFHLLLKTGHVPLATVMRRLLSGYAGYFNRRHRQEESSTDQVVIRSAAFVFAFLPEEAHHRKIFISLARA